MILRKLRLTPFAGFRDQEFLFQPGLNVVLGANDRGKSTLFRAIDAGLFLPTKLSKSTKEGKELLPRVLPIGGDHARLSMEWEAEGQVLAWEKVWGQGAGARFQHGAGPILQQEDRIEAALLKLLPVPPATMQNVLFMGQGALERTVDELGKKREALHSLGDLLRLAVDETGGISVDRLKAALAKKVELTFSHWDQLAGLPERGKGIEDPWLKNVGTILAAYYSRERCRRDWQQAVSLEAKRDQLLHSLQDLQERRKELREFVRLNGPLVESASARQALEVALDGAKREGETLNKDLSAWMQAASSLESLRPDLERLEPEKKRLEEELSAAVRNSKRAEILERFAKVKAAKEELASEQEKFAKLPQIKPEQVKRLDQLHQELEGLKHGLKAGKLQLQFTTKQDLELTFRKDLEGERKGLMVAGKAMTLNAGGRIQLTSEFFDLQVTSGDGKIAEIEQQFEQKTNQLLQYQQELAVNGLEQAKERLDRCREAQLAIKAKESALQALLGRDAFDMLEASALRAGEGVAGREPEVVNAELRLVEKEWSGKKDFFVRHQATLKDLERRHLVKAADELTNKMVAKLSEQTELRAKLAQLPELPAELGKLTDFLPRFQHAKRELEELEARIHLFTVSLAEVKVKLPEQSAQDFERAYREAELAFSTEMARGKALLLVSDEVKRMEIGAGDVFRGFREEFAQMVSGLSDGKYSQAQMNESLPTDFLRQDGAPIPYSWLSAGTKDSFALALRLAMVRHFLRERPGMILLDDPLVNMDPARQRVVSSMLQEFAGHVQVIVFTCHPAHASLFGGNCLDI